MKQNLIKTICQLHKQYEKFGFVCSEKETLEACKGLNINQLASWANEMKNELAIQ